MQVNTVVVLLPRTGLSREYTGLSRGVLNIESLEGHRQPMLLFEKTIILEVQL